MNQILRSKMIARMDEVRGQVAERDELIEIIAIALLTRKNVFILGDTGQAKSAVINLFRAGITGARQFERLMSKQTDEEALFGRLDLSSLIPGGVPEEVLEQDQHYQQLRRKLEAHLASNEPNQDKTFIIVNFDVPHDELPPLVQDYRYIDFKEKDAIDVLINTLQKKLN